MRPTTTVFLAGPKYNRPTLSFSTVFGNFLLDERSTLYECLACALLPDKNKEAALRFLFHLGCFQVDDSRVVSFRPDIVTHVALLSSLFPEAHQLVALHQEHVARSKENQRFKRRQATRRCRKRKKMITDDHPSRLTPPSPLVDPPFDLLSSVPENEPFDFPASTSENELMVEEEQVMPLITPCTPCPLLPTPSPFIGRFDDFTCTKNTVFKRCSREVKRLNTETAELLSRNFQWIQSGLSADTYPRSRFIPLLFITSS